MDTNKYKDLGELAGRFYPAEEAAECQEDIRRGDEMLEKHPAPAPRAELLADIRTQMLLAHRRSRRSHIMHRVYATVGLAACIAIIGGLAWLFAGGRGGSSGNGAEYAQMRTFPVIAEATQKISTFTSELDVIEDSVAAIQTVDFDSGPAGYQTAITTLEASLWKG